MLVAARTYVEYPSIWGFWQIRESQGISRVIYSVDAGHFNHDTHIHWYIHLFPVLT